MSNYSVLKQDINNNIYENQTQQITGTVLNAILNEMTASLGAGYQFAGVATLGMNPGDPDQRVFYLAGEGVYTNFGGIQVPAGKLGVLKWDNRWTLQTIDGLGGGGANLTGYVSLASTDDLPDEGVATLGYLCGENLYLYVGEGGDTKEGKYQNCGSFRGPQGDSVQDVEQTQTSLENGGVNKIKFTLSNGVSCEFQVRNGTTSSGLFPTLEALQAAYPSPVVGQYAFVGAGFPADIYVCTTAGTWTDSGEDYDGDNVDLTDYATKAEVTELEHKVDALEEGMVVPVYTEINGGIDNHGTVTSGTTYKHTSAIPVLKGQIVKVSSAGNSFAAISEDDNGTYTPLVKVTQGDANVVALYTWEATENMSISVCFKSTLPYYIRVSSDILDRVRTIEGRMSELDDLQSDLTDITNDIGDLDELTTEDKDSIVESINEINEHFLPDTETIDALDMAMDGDNYAGQCWNIRQGYFSKATTSSYNRTNPIKVKVGDVITCSTTISCSAPASSSTTAGHLMFTEEGATKSNPTGFGVLPFDASVGEVTITQEMYDNGCRYVGFSFAVADPKTLTIKRIVNNNEVICPKNIVKKVSNTHIAVFSQIHDDKYIEFNVKKEGTNTLYWRLQDSYFCTFDGVNFYRVCRVLSPSENEYVINLASGAQDPHVGGYHGDEETNIIKFFCDGIAYGIDDLPASLNCENVYYDEKSYMYGNDLGDPDAIITHYKKTFFNGGYVTENRIVALKQIPVSQFYAGLVCMDRNVGLHWTDDNLDIHTTDDNGGGGGEFNIADTGSSIVRYWNATNEVASMVETEIVDGDVQIPTVSIWSRSGSDHDAKYYRRGGGKTIQSGFTLSTRCTVQFNAK